MAALILTQLLTMFYRGPLFIETQCSKHTIIIIHTETNTFTSWVGYHYPKPHPTWLTVAIFKIAMTS